MPDDTEANFDLATLTSPWHISKNNNKEENNDEEEGKLESMGCVVSTCGVVEFVTQDFLFCSDAASCICVHISVLMNIKQLMFVL